VIKWCVLALVLLNLIFWGYTHLVDESSGPRDMPAVKSLPTLTIAPTLKQDSVPCVPTTDSGAAAPALSGAAPCQATSVAAPTVTEPAVAQP
jgi:hypothetical protein